LFNRKLFRSSAFTCLAIAFLATSQIHAQTQAFSASLAGVVKDGSGALVPEAKVTLSSAENGINRVFTTDSSGRYSYALVPPGSYALRVEKPGFEAYKQQGLVLGLGQAAEQDITLGLGTTGQTITVTGEAPLLNSDDANLSADVKTKQLQDLPANLRNVVGFVFLNSSVNNSSQYQVVNSPGSQDTSDQDITFMNFGGGFFGTTAFLLDGAWTTDAGWGGVIYVPSIDMVQEMKVEQNAFTAQYGWSSGNVVNIITKSGTSSFHGDGYEFLRNYDLDANNYFNNQNGLDKPAFRRNQFGIVAGGPMYIPGIYKQRQKTFIFGGYEGLRQSAPLTYISTVPTAAMKNGDFSALLGSAAGSDALGRAIDGGQIYNPFTTRQITAGQVDPTTGLVATATGYIRDPFAGNRIPASFINPVSAKLLTYFPNPTSSALVNNFSATAAAPSASDEYSVRVDHNVNDNTRLFGRYSYKDEFKQVTADFYGNSPAGPGSHNPDNRWSLGLGLNHVFNPTTVVSVNFGIDRWVEGNVVQAYPFNPSTLGLPSFIDGVSNQFPVISTTGETPLGPQNGTGEGTFINDTGTYSADLSKVVGAHSLSIGFMGVVLHNGGGRISPTTFNFSPSFTAGPDPNNPITDTGSGLASLLLGTGSSGSTGIAAFPYYSKHFYGSYLQDNWKATSKLTLNLGLRYEIQTAPVERHNGQSYFNYSAINPISPETGLNVPGEVVYSTSGKRGVYGTNYLNFAPRVGLAYQLEKKLVLRAGYGIFYTPSFSGGGPNPGYAQSTPYVGTIDGITPVNTLSNAFPSGLLPVTGNSLGALTNVGFATSAVNYSRPSTYIQQWMFDIQYSAGNNDLFDLSYVGNHGINIVTSGIDTDQLPTQYLSLGNALLNQVKNPFYGHIASSGCGLSAPTVELGQLLLPFPQYCSVSDTETAAGFSHYNALEFTYTHRVSHGLTILASYTWSKFIDDTQGFNGWAQAGSSFYRDNYNLALDKSLDGNDIPQSLVISYTYELPVGKGKPFGDNLSRPLNAVVGGWQVGGITTLKAGFPLSITTSINNACASFGCSQRPNIVGDPGVSNQTTAAWFNTAAFAQPAAYTFGDAPRYMSNLRAPGLAQWDLSIQKFWYFKEVSRLQFRAEMFNAFNHANFYAPDQNLGDPGFGQITASYPARDIQMALKLYW